MYSEFHVSFFGTFTPQLSESHQNSNKQAVAMGQKQEDAAVPPPSSSSSSSSADQTNEGVVVSRTGKGEEGKQGEAAAAKDDGGDDDDDDDDGYQTPTSPRHRIPPAIKCPAAPKKPKMPKRWHRIRIKAGTGRVRRRIEIGSALCPDTDDLCQRRSKKKKKKAGGDVTACR